MECVWQIIIRLTHANVWESMGNPYSCTQVIFFTTSHTRIRIRYCHAHWIWTCNEIKGSYDKIIITIVPSYIGKNITRLLPSVLLLMLCTCNNANSNTRVLVMFIWHHGIRYSERSLQECTWAHQMHTVYRYYGWSDLTSSVSCATRADQQRQKCKWITAR